MPNKLNNPKPFTRKIIVTQDGSNTFYFPEWDEQYHSKHGAIQEADHVFLNMGLDHYLEKNSNTKTLSILEIGFGTGLNCFMTFLKTQLLALNVKYTGVEAYPISSKEALKLNYVSQLKSEDQSDIFSLMHECDWEKEVKLSNNFLLNKRRQFFKDITDINTFDLIYFDAFGARVQPNLWTEEIFNIMHTALQPKGVLTTYAAKGSVRRAMQHVGFTVERLPGPPGKREMLRATKPEV